MLDTARLYHRAGKYEAAEDLYWQVMELDNSHPEPYHLLGMIALQARKLDPARQLMQTALELDPAEPIYHANMGTRHYQAGDYAAAETEYRRAVELDPEYAEAQFNLGILLKEHHRLRDAVEPLDEAARIQPAAKAFAPLAEVLIRLDHYEQADEVARAANQLGTQDRSGKGSLVRALQGLGRPRQALTWARELEAEAPDVAHYHQMLATTYMEAGFPNQAPDEARRAYQLDPQNPRNHPTLAQTLMAGMDWDEALEINAKALALAPEDEGLQAQRANILEQKGRIREAYEVVRPLIKDRDRHPIGALNVFGNIAK
ncbi:MAG: tetratricopeptide repeat protein [Thiohalorhabdus sp.]|uniref:tetratricopeptide repeat protein n=1 Tax=Thiohalorhabdus sp. TaxID=3094134 RepID=UPI002FC37119